MAAPGAAEARTRSTELLEGGMLIRFLLYTLGEDSEPTPTPEPDKPAETGAFIEEAARAGVLLAAGGVAPTATGTRSCCTVNG